MDTALYVRDGLLRCADSLTNPAYAEGRTISFDAIEVGEGWTRYRDHEPGKDREDDSSWTDYCELPVKVVGPLGEVKFCIRTRIGGTTDGDVIDHFDAVYKQSCMPVPREHFFDVHEVAYVLLWVLYLDALEKNSAKEGHDSKVL
jgi:hypothetical protein